MIKSNLHFSAHFVCAIDARTMAALRSKTSAADIPSLKRLMNDDQHVVRLAAAMVLEDLGPAGIAALKQAASSDDPRARDVAQDALLDLELRSKSKTQSRPQD